MTGRKHSEPSHCAHCGTSLVRGADGLLACASCGRVAYLDPKLAVAAIVQMDGHLVLVRRAIEPGYGKWSFPSGYVNRGEVIEQALAREVMEETGLNVDVQWLVGVYSREAHPVVLSVYQATATGGEMAALAETLEVGLFPASDLPEMAFEHDRGIIQDWQNGCRLRSL